MKFSASASTLLAFAAALAAQAVSVDAKLGSTDWDVRGDGSDKNALRQLKGSTSGTNGTGKSRSKSKSNSGDGSCGASVAGATAAARANDVCVADGKLYSDVTGSDVPAMGPTLPPTIFGAVFGCAPSGLGGNDECSSGYGACTTCIEGILGADPCASEIANLGACGLFGIPDASCPDVPFVDYQCCLTEQGVFDTPFWYNINDIGNFTFTDEEASRGHGSFKGIIPSGSPVGGKSTIEYWGTVLDLYNQPLSTIEYIQFDFLPKNGTCPDCTASSCGTAGDGPRVYLNVYSRVANTSTNLNDCRFDYAPQLCPEGEWSTFRATLNGASSTKPARTVGTDGACSDGDYPYEFPNYVLGNNILSAASQPNSLGTDAIFTINIGDSSTAVDNGLEVYIDNIQVKYSTSDFVDVYDLEPRRDESSKSKSGKSKSK